MLKPRSGLGPQAARVTFVSRKEPATPDPKPERLSFLLKEWASTNAYVAKKIIDNDISIVDH